MSAARNLRGVPSIADLPSVSSLPQQAILERPSRENPSDLEEGSVREMLRTEAPERDWLVKERLPLGAVGILAAPGASGKSLLVLQLALSCCTGIPWLGLDVGRVGSALILSAEDDKAETHRRLRIVMAHYRRLAQDPDAATELVAERLFVIDRVGEDNRLTAKEGGRLAQTELVDRVIGRAERMPEPALIVLDALSRFDGGDGNDNGDGTRLIEAAERIRKATGATVLLPHHVSKAGIRDPESGQEAVRGASGLVDGARWVGMMATMRRDDAKPYGLQPEDAKRYVRFTTPKANYSAPWDGMWLERKAGGVLVPAELQPVKRDRKQQGEDRYSEILPKLIELVRRKQDEQPMTRRQLREYAGGSGMFGVGDQTLRAILQRAIDEGRIKEHRAEGKRHAELRTW